MIPTSKLRWAQRKDPHVEFGIRTVLQQWWTNSTNVLFGNEKTPYGEWRDIPVEIEHD